MRVFLVSLLLVCGATATAQERAIDKEVTVDAPVAAVWQSWTSKAGIESFFAPQAEVDARVGGAFHIHIDPLAEPGMKGADVRQGLAGTAQGRAAAKPAAPATAAAPSTGLSPASSGCGSSSASDGLFNC